nr:CHASE3 domain-containing protein [uncultured Flavobacterium sp.]
MKFTEFLRRPLFLKIIFVISIAMIFFISGITYKHLFKLSESSQKVSHAYEISLQLEKLMSQLKDAETGNRGFIITRDSAFLEPYTFARIRLEASCNILDHLTKGNNIQNENVETLHKLIDRRLDFMEKSMVLTKQNRTFALQRNLQRGKLTMDSIRNSVANMAELETKILSIRQEDYNNTFSNTPILIYIIILIGLILSAAAFIKITKDLNELKLANNQLSIANETTSMAEIVGNFGCWQWDITKNKYNFSDNEYRLVGCEPQSFEASLENFMKFIHPEDLEYVQNSMNRMIKNENLPAFTYRVIREDGQLRYFRAIGKLIINTPKDKILLGTNSDITDEYNATLEIEERNRELERSNKELTAFNYAASHDLQEPLRKIQTFISRLMETEANSLSDSGKDSLRRIISAAERMRNLIDDLLQFSRSNKVEKNFELTSLNDLLENTKVELSPTIDEKHAVIISDNLPELRVIPFQIQQLFTNLISNSLKYSREGITPEITITTSKVIASDEKLIPLKTKDKFHKIVFQDNGIGFQQEYAEKIFILFNRLHNKNEYAGTGIGLAICRKIVENHSGYIFAEGIPNEGATFIIYLPVNNTNNKKREAKSQLL